MPASGLRGGFLMIRLETLVPFPAFCFLIKILAKSLSISMSATVSSRQYYPKHNLILDVQLRPKLDGKWEVGVEQTGGSLRVAQCSILNSDEIVVWVFSVSPRWDTGDQRGKARGWVTVGVTMGCSWIRSVAAGPR